MPASKSPSNYIHISKEALCQKYVVERKSMHETAKELKVSDGTILGKLRKFEISTRSISESLKGKPKSEEHRRKLRGVPKSREHRKKISMTRKRLFREGKLKALRDVKRPDVTRRNLENNPMKNSKIAEKFGKIRKNKTYEEIYGKERAKEVKERNSIARKGKHYSPATEFKPGYKHTKEEKKEIGIRFKALWRNPKFIKKVLTARNAKPNKLELRLDRLVQQVTPSYPYNGDFRQGISIGGRIPDFVSVNGENKCIELFGDYWHTEKVRCYEETEEGRIAHFKKFGWDCLVIWEHELREPEKVIGKIRKFTVSD